MRNNELTWILLTIVKNKNLSWLEHLADYCIKYLNHSLNDKLEQRTSLWGCKMATKEDRGDLKLSAACMGSLAE